MHTGQSGGQEGANQNQILKATRIEAIYIRNIFTVLKNTVAGTKKEAFMNSPY
jgi:hypothetical protein